MKKGKPNPIPEIKASGHMEGLLSHNTRDFAIRWAIKLIKHSQCEFDTIAYRGASGAITASIIAHKLKKPLVLVRKPEDNKGHSALRVEGPKDIGKYLIVDDFMSSGRTYDAIREALKEHHPDAECIGMIEVLYAYRNRVDMEYGPYKLRLSSNHKGEG